MKTHVKNLIALMILIIGAIGCQDDSVKPIVDYRCRILMQSDTSRTIYAYVPVPITMTIEKNDDQIGEYQFQYEILEGKGEIVVDSLKLKQQSPLNVDLDRLYLYFVPTSLGSHKIKFSFNNEEYLTEAIYNISAKDLMFEIKTENMPEKVLIEKTATFDLNVGVKEDSKVTEFDARLSVNNGDGYIDVIGNNDSTIFRTRASSLLGTDSIDDTPKDFTDKYFKVKIGKNKLRYTPLEPGENLLVLSIDNEYGYTQELDLPIPVSLPEFKLSTSADSIMDAGAINNFLLKIEDTDHHGENIYSISYRNLKNSGTLRINNNEIQVGSSVVSEKGENILEFIPKDLGEVQLEFIVKDKYNSVKKDTAVFQASRTYVQLQLANYDSIATLHGIHNFNFSVSKKNYTGKYYYSIEQEPQGNSKISVNGEEYTGGKIEIVNPLNTQVSFIPQTTGKNLLILNVYDDFGSETRTEIPFNVSNSSSQIVVSNNKTELALFEETAFQFSIAKANYTGTYQFEILQYKENTAGVYGTFVLNENPYPGGRIAVTNPQNTNIIFRPSEAGQIDLEIIVYDDFKGEIRKIVPFTVANTQLAINVTEREREIIVGKETNFKFKVSKPNLDSSKDLTYKIVSKTLNYGVMKINGSTYYEDPIKVKNDEITSVYLTPKTEGMIEFDIIVSDEWGAERIENIKFNASNPAIVVELGENFSNTLEVNNLSHFNFSVSKEYYNGDYFFSIVASPQNTCDIYINDILYGGDRQTLTYPSNTKVSLLPKELGEIRFTLNISDETGAKKTKEFVVNVNNNPVVVSISNFNAQISTFAETFVNMAISKRNYKGTYQFEIETDPISPGTIKVDNSVYSGGRLNVSNIANTKISFTPNISGFAVVRITVYDEFDGKTVENLYYSIINPPTTLNVTNKESTITFNTATSFNVAANKNNYSSTFNYEIEQFPPNSGTIKVDGKDYTGGITAMTNPKNMLVNFIPKVEGYVNLRLRVYDELNGYTDQFLPFNISNPEIGLTLNAGNKQLTVGKPTSFTIKSEKPGYTGNFTYEVSALPVDAGTLLVNGNTSLSGTLSPNPSTVTFTPLVTGTAIINVKVYDTEGKMKEDQVSYFISNSNTNITFLNWKKR